MHFSIVLSDFFDDLSQIITCGFARAKTASSNNILLSLHSQAHRLEDSSKDLFYMVGARVSDTLVMSILRIYFGRMHSVQIILFTLFLN